MAKHRTMVKATDSEGNVEVYVFAKELGEEEAIYFTVQQIAKVQQLDSYQVTEAEVRDFYEFEVFNGTCTHL